MSTEDFTYRGTFIPKGTVVIINTVSDFFTSLPFLTGFVVHHAHGLQEVPRA